MTSRNLLDKRFILQWISSVHKDSFAPIDFLSTLWAFMSVADEKPFDSANNDDQELLALGYKPSFKREFTNLATVSFPKCKNLSSFPLKTFSPRSALHLVSWYEIIRRGEDGYTQFTLNRECPRALQLHSTLHLSLAALHQWVPRINNEYERPLIHWRSYGVGFLEPRCASRLVLALRRSSAHIQRVVDCRLSFVPPS